MASKFPTATRADLSFFSEPSAGKPNALHSKPIVFLVFPLSCFLFFFFAGGGKAPLFFSPLFGWGEQAGAPTWDRIEAAAPGAPGGQPAEALRSLSRSLWGAGGGGGGGKPTSFF